MNTYSLSHLSDETLLRDLAALVARDRTITARLLAHLAEVDSRKLYLPAAYPSMYTWCVGELGLSEDAAFIRIRAARTARRFPAILEALADGRLHLTAVGLLAAHLTEDNAAGLIAEATHRSKAEIETLLAERFPQPDLLARVAPIPADALSGRADPAAREPNADSLVPERVDIPVPGVSLPAAALRGPVPTQSGDPSRVRPLSPQKFGVQFTMGRTGHDKLRRAQDLLGHRVAPGDLAQVFERALDALIERLEKQKLAATSQPRSGRRASGRGTRHVPAHVRRAVWARDGGRCTFESESGRRCEARRGLEFDHVIEHARGGAADASGIRLRCRAHNQYTAGLTFGSEFMRHKRIAATEGR